MNTGAFQGASSVLISGVWVSKASVMRLLKGIPSICTINLPGKGLGIFRKTYCLVPSLFMQKLIHKGKVLEDGQTLGPGGCALPNNAKLMLLVSTGLPGKVCHCFQHISSSLSCARSYVSLSGDSRALSQIRERGMAY